jgi:hypothetical protein
MVGPMEIQYFLLMERVLVGPTDLFMAVIQYFLLMDTIVVGPIDLFIVVIQIFFTHAEGPRRVHRFIYGCNGFGGVFQFIRRQPKRRIGLNFVVERKLRIRTIYYVAS